MKSMVNMDADVRVQRVNIIEYTPYIHVIYYIMYTLCILVVEL